MKDFIKPDGSVSYFRHFTSSDSQCMPVALFREPEGDVNATGLAIGGAIKRPLEVLGVDFVPLYDEQDFERFDMIIAMDDNNYEALFRLAPDRAAQQKIYRFREFLRRNPNWSYIPDPYYEGHEGFELVLDLLEDGCEGVLQHIKNR